MFDSLDISASGLRAQRVRMDAIAQNVANINTTHDEHGRAVPYRRRFALLAPGRPEDPSKPGVRVTKVELDNSPFRKVYDPTNPDADAEGNVLHPNIDLAIEVVNAMEASRAYEANVTAMEVTKAMINASLRLLV